MDYDVLGNVTRVTSTNSVFEYTYDPLNRATNAVCLLTNIPGFATVKYQRVNLPRQPSHARCQRRNGLAPGTASQLRTLLNEAKLAYTNSTSKRLARRVALSRSTKGVVGGSFTLDIPFAFGDGCDCPGYGWPWNTLPSPATSRWKRSKCATRLGRVRAVLDGVDS